MPKIDVVDEAIINAEPSTVYKPLMDEYEGVTSWWMPHWEAKPRGNVPFSQLGGIVDVTVHRTGTPRFAVKSTEIVKDKFIKTMYFEGDFLGEGEWALEPLDGKKVQFRLNVKTNNLLFTFVSPFVNIGKIHSDVMLKGFIGLNKFLNQ